MACGVWCVEAEKFHTAQTSFYYYRNYSSRSSSTTNGITVNDRTNLCIVIAHTLVITVVGMELGIRWVLEGDVHLLTPPVSTQVLPDLPSLPETE